MFKLVFFLVFEGRNKVSDEMFVILLFVSINCIVIYCKVKSKEMCISV